MATTGQKFDWKVVLDEFGKVKSDSLSGIKNLQSARWLPLSNGGNISPDDVLDFDKLAADIDRLASNCGYCYAGVLALASEVQRHPNFAKLKPFFSSGKSGLEKLGLLMVEAGDQSVGSLVPTNKLVECIDFLASLPSLPGWGVVKAAIDAVGVERVADVTDCLLINGIQQSLSAEKLVAVLNEISQRSEEGQADVFNLYLKQLVANSPEILQEALSQIQLQAIDGQWKAAKLLCAGVEGVDKSSVLNRGQAQILKDYIASLAASHRLNAEAAGPSIGGDEPVTLTQFLNHS